MGPRRWTRLLCLLLAVIFWAAFSADAEEAPGNWPAWRGAEMNGLAQGSNPPVEFSESKNLAWKVEVPGSGFSTPIIWGDLILLQSALPVGETLSTKQQLADWQAQGREIYRDQSYVKSERRQQFLLLAYDRHTGEERWRKVLREDQPHEGIHPTNSWASGSPVTDGEHIFAFFGSQGLFATDMQGNLVWEKDLGDMDTRNGWGEGASAALHGDKLVVPWDHEGQSFIAAFDKSSGRELWRQDRDEVTTWFTPLIVERGGKSQVITTGAGHVRGYDLETGEEIWHGPGLTVNAIPTPLYDRGRVYLTSGYRGNILLAIDLDKARGNIEESGAIAWRYKRDTPYVASPIIYEDTIYFVKHLRGIFTALDVRSGEVRFGPVRLEDMRSIYASPVAAAGRLYLPGRYGNVIVIEHGPELRVLAINRFDDGFDASPAIVGDDIYLRGKSHLYRISTSAP